MKKFILLVFMFCNIYASTINVALASNVTYVFTDLVKKFNQTNPNIKIHTTISSSGKLSSQIFANAPYDLFLSANMRYANYIYEHNLSITKPVVYAKGTLSLLSSKKRDFSKGIKILLNKTIKRIAIANNKTAPYGYASKEVLLSLKLYDKLKSKFIYGESIGQTLFYTLNAANIGFVATSSLKSKKLKYLKLNENYINIPSELYTPIKQGLVILNNAKNNNDVKKFYDFLLSKKAKIIFKKYGYK